MPLNSLSGLTGAQQTVIESEFLRTSFPLLFHGRMALLRPTVKGEYTVTFTRQTDFGVFTTPLTEGSAPESASVALTQVSVTPLRYGGFTYLGEELVDRAPFEIAMQSSKLMGRAAARTSDRLARALLIASGTSQTVDGVAEASQTSANVMNGQELLEASATLDANNAMRFAALDDTYPIIMNPYVWYDCQRDPLIRNTFLHAAPKSSDNPLFGTARADWQGIRFFVSSDAYINTDGGSGSQDTYHSLLFGEEFYGIAGFGGLLLAYAEGEGTVDDNIGGAALIFHGREDYPPLNQRESVGFKIDQQELQLNSAWMIRIISASSIGS